MARGSSNPNSNLFSTEGYIQSWAAHNTYYAARIAAASPNFLIAGGLSSTSQYTDFRVGNQYTKAALYSGIVNVGGYGPLFGSAPGDSIRASPNYAAKDANLNYLGMRKAGKADKNIDYAGGRSIIPGAAFTPSRSKTGRYSANKLSKFMAAQGGGGPSQNLLRYRNRGGGISDSTRSWKSTLTQSTGSQKGKSGFSQSSVDTTGEKYATKETAMGANMYDTDERVRGERFERSWAGYKELSPHSSNAHFFGISGLAQMYRPDEKPQGGDARRNKVRL